MKVLFSMMPMHGHLHSLVPLALGLKEHGHEVAFATAASYAPMIRRIGFEHFSCGVDHDGKRVIFQTLKELDHLPADAAPGPHLFAELLAPLVLEDLPGIVDAWQPDLLVHDPVELAAGLVAETRGLPYVLFSWAFYFQKATMKQWWGKGLADLRTALELPPDPELDALWRYLAIDFMPPSWTPEEFEVPPVAHSFHAPLFDRSEPEGLPTWVLELPDRPTVYATLGTALNHSPETFRAIIDAFSGEDLNLIVTVGPGMDPRQFDPLADNVRVARYIPQTLVLPYCDAVIAHGGYNTLISALWHGLPLVVTPLTAADQPINGRRCAAMGVGLLEEGRPPEPAALRDAVLAVLRDEKYSDRARELQTELRNLPDLGRAVTLMETLAENHQPVLRPTPAARAALSV